MASSGTVNTDFDTIFRKAMLDAQIHADRWRQSAIAAGALAKARDLAAEVDMLKAQVKRLEETLLRLGVDPQ